VRTAIFRRRWRRPAATIPPLDVERVSFRSTIRIIDAHYRDAAITRIANQLLPAAAIHAAESEESRIRRHHTCAFESPPLGRLPGYIAKGRRVAADLDLGGTVHYDFDRALSFVRSAAAANIRATLHRLTARHGRDRRDHSNCKK